LEFAADAGDEALSPLPEPGGPGAGKGAGKKAGKGKAERKRKD
jgi:hypothetical protein